MIELHHRLEGRDDGPVVALGSSLGADLRMWDPQVPALAARFRVLRYDTRGHGRSPAPPGPYSIADLGADLLALLDRHGIASASLAGVSLGGMTAMWVASEAPERVERLVLCCTSALLGPKEMWDDRIETVRGEGMGPLVEPALERWFTPAADPQLLRRFDAMLRAIPPEGYAGCCAAIRDMDLRERLTAIRAPTLVIAAADDPATPPDHGELIAASIPGARLTTVDDARHLASVERAEQVTAAMLEHLLG